MINFPPHFGSTDRVDLVSIVLNPRKFRRDIIRLVPIRNRLGTISTTHLFTSAYHRNCLSSELVNSSKVWGNICKTQRHTPNVQKVPNQQEKDGLYPSTYERSRELSLTKLGDYEMKNQKWLQKTTLTLTFPMSPKIFTWLIDVALSAWIAPLKSLRVTHQPFTQQISDDRRVESRRLGTFSIRSG